MGVTTIGLNQEWVPIERSDYVLAAQAEKQLVIYGRHIRKLHRREVCFDSVFDLLAQASAGGIHNKACVQVLEILRIVRNSSSIEHGVQADNLHEIGHYGQSSTVGIAIREGRPTRSCAKNYEVGTQRAHLSDLHLSTHFHSILASSLKFLSGADYLIQLSSLAILPLMRELLG
jgi:hypothetical protein